ncbi:MAG: glycoside hydrolase family 125 protein [Faecalibacillus sp.]
MQGLTSLLQHEREALIQTIIDNTGGTGYCHESFDVNDDTQFTRPWFCWADLYLRSL